MLDDPRRPKDWGALRGKDTCLCAIFRILGNDLPPLHGWHQTYENTRFIIENEPRHAGTTRKWILNRISDENEQSRLIELLERNNEEYILIPFNHVHYAGIDRCEAEIEADIARHLESDVKSFQGWTLDADDADSLVKLHRKILYLTNINGARNLALRTGKKEARWVAPLDSGCYLPAPSWDSICRHLEDSSAIRYLAVPLVRLRHARVDNLVIRDDCDAVRFFQDGMELEGSEPQLFFHRESVQEFNEVYRYGRRDKIELLLRLGLYESLEDALAHRCHRSAMDGRMDGLALGGAVLRLPYRRSHSEAENLVADLLAARQERCDSAVRRTDSMRDQLDKWLGALAHSEKAGDLRRVRLTETCNEEAREELAAQLAHFVERQAVCEERLRFYGAQYKNARSSLARTLSGVGALVRYPHLNGDDLELGPGDVWLARNNSVARALRRLEAPGRTPTNMSRPRASTLPPRQTFALYRILGNDLPPRHAWGQTAKNLRFILDNEPEFPNCQKKWIVNRIVDHRQEKEIIRILEDADQDYLHIPFIDDEYDRIGFNFEDFPEPGYLFGDAYRRLSDSGKRQVVACLFRLKALYVMNNNGARNTALTEGRRVARWVLPWDGNCFLTGEAWDEIEYRIYRHLELKYLIVPMARSKTNESVLDPCFQPMPVEEPQIIFRQDAAAEFDENIPYGYRPKVTLLQRLGVPGIWDSWAIYPWDHFDRSRYADAEPHPRAVSWVLRLQSGMPQHEHYSQESRRERGRSRHRSMLRLLSSIDVRLARRHFDAERLFVYRESTLADERGRLRGASEGDGQYGDVLVRLRRAAERALEDMRYTVVDKTDVPTGIDPHDYWQPAATWWPDPSTLDGLPYVNRPKRRRLGADIGAPGSEQYDRTRMQRLFDNTTVLALAWYFTGDERYADRAADNIRTWFLQESTRMTPHLVYAQARLGWPESHSNTGIRESRDFYFFLDAVRLIRRSWALSAAEYQGMQRWCSDFLKWLMSSAKGARAASRRDIHGIDYDLQAAALAVFVGDVERFLECVRNAQMRIGHQFEPTGVHRHLSGKSASFRSWVGILQSWANLCRIAARGGIDLVGYRSRDGSSLRRAFEYLLEHGDKAWPSRHERYPGTPQSAVLWHHVHRLFGDLEAGFEPLPCRFKMPSTHGWSYGIRPFWQLGL